MNEEFNLEIPSEAQYVSVARLAVAGVASHAAMPEEQIEDLKLCVSEACNNVIKLDHDPEERINIRCMQRDDGFVVKVTSRSDALDKHVWARENTIGKTFIETLMDDVKYEHGWDGTSSVEMKMSSPHQYEDYLKYSQ